MKRNYSFGVLVLLYLIFIAIVVSLNLLLDPDSIANNITTVIVGIVINYIVCAGLLRTRTGNFKEYLSNIKTINKNMVFTNIILSIVLGVLMFLSFLVGYLIVEPLDRKLIILGVLIFFIIMLAINMLLTYTSFVVADERNRNDSLGQIFSKIFSIGKKLMGKTFKIYLKKIILPLIILVALWTGAIVTGGIYGIGSVSILTIVSLLIYVLLIIPTIWADFSNFYIDETDYDLQNTIQIEENFEEN